MARATAKRKATGNTYEDDDYKGSKYIKTDDTTAPRRSARVVSAKAPADVITTPRPRQTIRKHKAPFRFMGLPQELRDMVYEEL
jgi:hypothetical protein